MQWSEQRAEIAAALVLAQSKITGAEKRSKNPSLRNEYADLDSVWDTIRPALQAASLAVVQAPSVQVFEGMRCAVVITEIVHSSGQWLRHESAIPVPEGNRGVNASQASAQAITYARRYALIALLGCAGTEDLDGSVTKHDPSWAAERKRFCSALREKFSLSYEQLADHLERAGHARPSQMDTAGRRALWHELPKITAQITGAQHAQK